MRKNAGTLASWPLSRGGVLAGRAFVHTGSSQLRVYLRIRSRKGVSIPGLVTERKLMTRSALLKTPHHSLANTPGQDFYAGGAGCPIFWFWLRLGFLRRLAGLERMGLQSLAINLKEPSPFYKGVLGGGCFSPSRGLFTSAKSPC